MIPLTAFYDEYISFSKLSEQIKPFEYIVPPPSRGVGTKNNRQFIGLRKTNLNLSRKARSEIVMSFGQYSLNQTPLQTYIFISSEFALLDGFLVL